MARQYAVPGFGFVNENDDREYVIPGYGFIDETVEEEAAGFGYIDGSIIY